MEEKAQQQFPWSCCEKYWIGKVLRMLHINVSHTAEYKPPFSALTAEVTESTHTSMLILETKELSPFFLTGNQ